VGRRRQEGKHAFLADTSEIRSILADNRAFRNWLERTTRPALAWHIRLAGEDFWNLILRYDSRDPLFEGVATSHIDFG
jgi:hypothetical protein